MSVLKVNQITNKNEDGGPEFTRGITVSAGYALTCNGGIVISGIVTATSFSGDGSQITNLSVIETSKTIAVQMILDPLPYRY